MNRIFEPLIPTQFRDAFFNTVDAIADFLQVKPEWIPLILHSESGLNPQTVANLSTIIDGKNITPAGYDENGHLLKAFGVSDHVSPAIRCQYRATGINQLMPATAKGLGTLNSKVFSENIIQQLAHVKAFYTPVKGRIHSFTNMYLYNFMPAELGKPEDTILPDFVFKSNRGLDANHDGHLTIGEFNQIALAHVPPEYRIYI